MVHVLLAGLDTPRDQDWIDEGLAEYLSLRALKDSGTISAQRYAATIAELRRWGGPVMNLRTTSSAGPVTARAVTVFVDLDAELRRASNDQQSLATLVRGMLQPPRRVDLDSLRSAARKIIGKESRALALSSVPGLD
jgi:predicted metalloprotease with PDZ domain